MWKPTTPREAATAKRGSTFEIGFNRLDRHGLRLSRENMSSGTGTRRARGQMLDGENPVHSEEIFIVKRLLLLAKCLK